MGQTRTEPISISTGRFGSVRFIQISKIFGADSRAGLRVMGNWRIT